MFILYYFLKLMLGLNIDISFELILNSPVLHNRKTSFRIYWSRSFTILTLFPTLNGLKNNLSLDFIATSHVVDVVAITFMDTSSPKIGNPFEAIIRNILSSHFMERNCPQLCNASLHAVKTRREGNGNSSIEVFIVRKLLFVGGKKPPSHFSHRSSRTEAG